MYFVCCGVSKSRSCIFGFGVESSGIILRRFGSSASSI